jgi:hypothetical protein
LKKLLLLILSISSLASFASIDKTKALSAYGKIGIIGHVLGEDLSLEDNGSRVGVYATKKLYNKYDMYVRGEWSFNALNNTSNLSIGDNKNFVSEAEDAQTFNRRLGYLAIDLKEYGQFAFGKTMVYLLRCLFDDLSI